MEKESHSNCKCATPANPGDRKSRDNPVTFLRQLQDTPNLPVRLEWKDDALPCLFLQNIAMFCRIHNHFLFLVAALNSDVRGLSDRIVTSFN